MNKIKIVVAYIVVILAVSCGSKKKSTYVKTEKSDTLVLKTEVIKAPVIHDTFTLKEICKDSTVTEFEKIFIRDTDTVKVTLFDNSLRLQVSQAERVITEKDSVLKIQSEKLEELRETVKSKWNLKVVLVLVGVIVLLWLFPSVPSTINRFIRKLFIGL